MGQVLIFAQRLALVFPSFKPPWQVPEVLPWPKRSKAQGD